MSFDVYLVSFTNQRPSGIARAAIHAAFGDDVRWVDERTGRIEGYCSIHLTPLDADPNLVSCVSINRPCGERFWDSLYEIMRLGNVVLFVPGGRPLIAESAVPTDIPVFKNLGDLLVVHSRDEIVDYIESS